MLLPRLRPLFVGSATYLALIVVWKLGISPLFPEELTRLYRSPGEPLWDEESGTTVFTKGDVQGAPVVVLGDSRVQHGFRPEVFEGEGENVAMVYGAGGQLSALLPIASRLPARRWIVLAGPMILHRPSHERAVAYQRQLFEENNAIPLRRRIDRDGNDWLDSLRRDSIRIVRPNFWDESWFESPDPKDNLGFMRRAVRPATDPERWIQLDRIRDQLEAAIADGIEVVFVRMPQSRAILAIQDKAFPAKEFPQLCESLSILYLDHSREPYPTKDGLHLTYRASVDYDRFLTGELRRLTDWFE